MRTVGLILAAGASTRMGTHKALLELDGSTYLTHIASRLLDGGCTHIYVVTGAQALKLPNDLRTHSSVIMNEYWRTGIRSSIQAGLREIEADSICIQPVDTPGVSAQTIQRLISIHPTYGAVPTYRGVSGHPVVITKVLQRRLLENDSQSLREVLESYPINYIDVQDRAVLNNINTPDAHGRLIAGKLR